jgi:hypothetical protein
MVLKQALQQDYTFVIDEILDGRMPVTNDMVELLLREN